MRGAAGVVEKGSRMLQPPLQRDPGGALPEEVSDELIAWFGRRLLRWHEGRTRKFAWRRNRVPWLAIMAEVLLQRTDSRQVEPVYVEAARRFATPRAFRAASLRSLRQLFRPLGLGKRIGALRRIAEQIENQYGGSVPDNERDLLRLHGVGRYIANAVLCFAFQKDAPIVDSNVIRVFQRFFGVRSSRARPRDDPGFWRLAMRLIPRGRARAVNLGLLDFEALVCIPRNPLCPDCPVNARCAYWAAFRKRRTKISLTGGRSQ
jgi:A/G-specific adenine glycosylase